MQENTRVDGVVFLHGIFCTRLQMRRLAKFIGKQGYKTLNLGYPSLRKPLEDIADTIEPQITSFAASLSGQVHFVGFSMGGLVIRAFLHRYRPANLGRVVMLGTPNNGSEMADLFRDWWLFRKLYGPAGQQLVTDLDITRAVFGIVDYPLGIVAGDCSLDPLATKIIGKPNDGKVSVESTKLPGMKDHIIVRLWHTFLPRNRGVWRQVLNFLKEERFARS